MKTNIQTYINNYLNCSDSDLKGIDDYFDKKTFPKKTILLREGEVCKLEGFILSGCVKSYLIQKSLTTLSYGFLTLLQSSRHPMT